MVRAYGRAAPWGGSPWVGTSQGAPDYVVVDRYSPAWGGRPPVDAAAWASERTKVGYTLVLNEGGYQVARRNG